MEQKQIGISSEQLEQDMIQQKPFLLFDLRTKESFEKSHVSGSVHAVCDTNAKEKILPKIPKNAKIVLISEPEEYAKEIAQMMKSFGLDVYFLIGGFSSWKGNLSKGDTGKTILADTLAQKLDKVFLLDVRDKEEYSEYQIPGSVNIPLSELFDAKTISSIPKDKEIVTICPQGNRAGMATFMLQREGYNVKTLQEGLKGWSSAVEHFSQEYEIIDGQKVKVVQVRKIGKGCISYIVSLIDNNTNINDDEAIVIDPVFPIDEYIRIAISEIGDRAKITKVLDTHLHADHVSSARELANKIDAQLYLSSYEDYSQDVYQKQGQKQFTPIKEGDVLTIGKKDGKPIELKVIHTPGHTAGGICFLIGEKLLFTGDTLFVDSIGRPDLRDKVEEFASMLYNTLHNKIFNIHNKKDIIIFPAHTDKIINRDEMVSDNLDNIQKKLVILDLDKIDFVRKISSINMPTPSQFKEIILMNKGEKTITSLEGIQELEMGPNRCSISI